jgi:hypothetical protein
LTYLPSVSDAATYYNHAAIVADRARYDACVKFLWPVHMTSTLLQVVLICLAVVAALIFLVIVFNSILILSLSLDRLVRKMMLVAHEELLDESE